MVNEPVKVCQDIVSWGNHEEIISERLHVTIFNIAHSMAAAILIWEDCSVGVYIYIYI